MSYNYSEDIQVMGWKDRLIMVDGKADPSEIVVYKNGEFFKLTPITPTTLNCNNVVAPKPYDYTSPMYIKLDDIGTYEEVNSNKPYYDEYPVLTNLEVDANKKVMNQTLYPSDI